MPMWPQPDVAADQRVQELHAQVAHTQPTNVASAPATWLMMGEHTDYYGGITTVGLSHLRTAAAVSPRTDPTLAVRIEQLRADGTTSLAEYETTLEELGTLAAAQQPTSDEEGQVIVPDPPTGGPGIRAAGIVWMMVNRQMLSRETTGMDITVVTDIPRDAGLGELAALDVAVAMALGSEPEEAKDAPMRARLAEVCGQAVTLFSEAPELRARHTAALRGAGETMSVIDYADNSVTQAPHPVGKEMAAFVIAVPGEFDPRPAYDHIRARQRFIADACHAFGTDNVRLLPDAPQRVIDWLNAVREVHGAQGQPTVEQATEWMKFFEDETQRSQAVASALRSRRGSELFGALAASTRELKAGLGLDNSKELVELATVRGATCARTASAGVAPAVVAYVPAAKASNFAADLAADGLIVIPLAPGAHADRA